MNTIKIYLAESGRVADLRKDFPLYKGQFNDKLLNVLVPTSILAPQFELQHYIGQISGAEAPTDEALNNFVAANTYPTRSAMQGDIIEFYNSDTQSFFIYTYDNDDWGSAEVDSFGTINTIAGTSIKIGMLATKPNGTIYESKSYFMRYLKTLTYQNVEYALYERKLPKEFTSFVGQGQNAPTLIINVVNVDTENNAITSIVTSQSCSLDVMASNMLDQDESIEASDLENLTAEINTIASEVALKQDKTDDNLNTTSKQVVGAINELDTEVEANTYQVGINTSDIVDIKAEQITQNSAISTNTDNISTNTSNIASLNTRVSNLEQQSAVEETYIGQMQGDTLPTDAQLNDFVFDTAHRTQQGGDVVIFILQIAGATNKNYKYTYSRVSQSWSGYEIPATEPASNTDKGIVKGSYGSDKSTQVNITNGDIQNIYVKDNSNQLRDLAEYLNTDNTTLTNTASQVVTNTSDIATNTGNIATNTSTLSNILNGTTAVAKATRADQDGNGNNITQTYLTQTAGATKQQLYNYALPRTFNDVSFLASNNTFGDTLPSTFDPIYTAESSSVGDTQLFYADKTISNAEFQLASKNSYTATFYATSSIDCTVEFRLTTEIYLNGAWQTANIELTEPILMTNGEIKKLSFGSTLNSLSDVLSIENGDKIRQTLEVITQTSDTITFAVYSNETYPSSFYLNTTSQNLVLTQGLLGELPQFTLTGISGAPDNEIIFTLPSAFVIEDGVEAFFTLSYTGVTDNNTALVLKQGIQDIIITTPEIYGLNATAKVSNMRGVYADNINMWVFTGTFRIINGDTYVFADVENIALLLNNYYTKAQVDSALQGKQATLSQAQLNAVNSGIDATKVAQIAANTNSISTNAGNIAQNTSDISALETTTNTLQSSITTNTANIATNATNITALQSTTSSLQSQVSNHTTSISGLTNRVASAEGDIDAIEAKIPVQASSSNQLADKDFVNSTIQTNTAHFRGNWATWSAVPTNVNDYPADADGNKIPTTNDYMVVQDASGYTGTTLAGTWRFKYVGVWATNGIAGWQPEYQVNETPLTAAQLAALNSGATSTNIAQIATNTSNIASNTTAIGNNTSAISGLTTRVGTAETDITNIKSEQTTQNTSIGNNTNAISALGTRMTTAEGNISAIPNNYVSYTSSQTLTDAQKAQARANIGAGNSGFDGSYTNLTDKPVLKTDNTTAQSTSASETINGTINLHKVAKTGTASDLIGYNNLAQASSVTNLASRVTTAEGDIDTIEGKIPNQASTSNQLADKAFVNSSVQTATANFRGSWNTWADVPTSASSYPTDYAGSTTPTTNDYMVVIDASGYNTSKVGTWRFKYTGDWSTNGKSGWQPEYQINEEPLTAAQIAALNSGITSTLVTQIGTNQTNIGNKVDKTSTVIRIYGTDNNGNQTTIPYSDGLYPNFIVKRQADSSHIMVPTTPTNANHAASKAYVDDKVVGYAVPKTQKVNGKTLSSDITLTASDVGALPSNTTYVSSVNGNSGTITDIQTTNNLVTSFSSTTSDSKYPSEKLVKDSLDNKIDETTTAYRIYGTNSNGEQTTLTYNDIQTNGGYIVQRKSNGEIAVPTTPINNSDATSKSYVDTLVAGKISKATLLWSNPNIGYGFQEQTITISNASGYDYLLVEFRQIYNSESRNVQLFRNYNNVTNVISYSEVDNSNNRFVTRSRAFTKNSDTSITWGLGRTWYSNSGIDNDYRYMEPSAIYGITL